MIIPPYYKWQVISFNEFSDLLENTRIDIRMLKDACKMLDIKYPTGGILFIPKAKTLEEERDLLLDNVSTMHSDQSETVIAYRKEYRNNPTYSYYTVFMFSSNDIHDLKKILKVHKLKAFA